MTFLLKYFIRLGIYYFLTLNKLRIALHLPILKVKLEDIIPNAKQRLLENILISTYFLQQHNLHSIGIRLKDSK